MRKRHSRLRQRQQTEMDITAFMNLMVVLVPFLLMTAVFSHISILDLHLPSLGSAPQDKKDKPEFELRITIRKNELVISDNKGGLIRSIPKENNQQNYKILTATLKQVKARFQDKTSATILAEQRTEYETLVKVMDAVRAYTTVIDGELIRAELFPDISIGDAAKR